MTPRRRVPKFEGQAMTDPRLDDTTVEAEWVSYRVVEHRLTSHRPSNSERVVITAIDGSGDLLTWSAEPSRVPALGSVIEVSVRRVEDDPPPDQEPKSS